MSAVERGELRWKATKRNRLNPISINQTGNLYTPITGQIFDQSAITNITVDHLRLVQFVTLNHV